MGKYCAAYEWDLMRQCCGVDEWDLMGRYCGVYKVGDHSRGWLESSLFDSYYTKV